MLKKISFTLVILCILSIAVVQFIRPKSLANSKFSNRTAYEKFLLKKMKESGLEEIAKEEKQENKKEKLADFPQLSELQDYFLTMDPALGCVPRERLVQAMKYTRSVGSMKNSLTDPLVQWTNIPSNMGGRCRALAWDPNDSQHRKAWAGGITGGLWYNNNATDSTTTWTAVNDFWSCLSVSCIVFDPVNPQIMYVGTGEAATAVITYRESSNRGVGIFKSTDGGQTWNLMPSTTGFAYVNDILVKNEGGSSVIYAGVVSGKYMGVAHQSNPTDGLYRSTNGGTSWTQVLPNITGENKPWPVSDIEINSNGRIFIGTQRNLDGKGGATILWSDAGTAGTWTVYNNYLLSIPANTDYYLPGRVVLACAPSNPSVVYAAIAAGFVNPWEIFHGRYILKSTNAGVSWNEVSTPPDDSGNNWAYIAWHALSLAVDPTNADVLWAGALNLNRSTDGGQTWTKLTDWALMYYGGGGSFVHADLHKIAFNPWNPAQTLFGCDGGVFYCGNSTSSSGLGFSNESGHLSTLQFYSCAIDPDVSSQNVVGGLQDNGCLLYSGNPLTINDMVSGGDGALCFYDKDDPGLMITSIYYNVYYIFNGGSFSNYISDYQCGYFINPTDYDYKHNTLYSNVGPMFGSGTQDQLLRLDNIDAAASGTYLPMNTGVTVPFSHVKVSPNSTLTNTVVFAGSMSGRLFKVNHANTTPVVTEITGSSFPMGAVSCVAVGHSDDTLLVTFSNYGVNSVWQTYNGGQTWKNVEGNLPDMPIRWAIFHPGNSEQALLGTELGVWSCSNLGSATNIYWQPANQGLANVRVDMLQIRDSDRKVCAASHGRGLFTGTYNLDPTTLIPNYYTSDFNINVYPNPVVGDYFSIKTADFKGMNWCLLNATGQRISEGKLTEETTVLTINRLKMPNGVYFIQFSKANQTKELKKILIQR